MVVVLVPQTSTRHSSLFGATTNDERLFPTNLTFSCDFTTMLKKLIYRVSQEERTKLREGVPYVKLYRYNPKHLYPKLNGHGDNGQRSLKL